MNGIAYTPDSSSEADNGIYETGIKGLFFIENHKFHDDRGFYTELSRIPELESVIGKPFIIKQLNHARSLDNVARGFHAERWNKLVTVLHGTCFAALADIRPDSETFGQVETFILGQSEDALQGSLFISEGIANSLCVISGPVDYLYAVDMLYKDRDPGGDKAISLFDDTLKVNWPISKEEMIISDRDLNSITLREMFPDKF